MRAHRFLFFLLPAVFFSCASVFADYELSDAQPVIPETTESASGGYTLEVSDQNPVFVLPTSPADGDTVIVSPGGAIPVAPPLDEGEGEAPSEDITKPAEQAEPEMPISSVKEKGPEEEKEEDEKTEEENKEEEKTEEEETEEENKEEESGEKVTHEQASQEQQPSEQDITPDLKSEVFPDSGIFEDTAEKQETVTTITLLEGRVFVSQRGKIASGKIIIKNQAYREGEIYSIGEDTIARWRMAFLTSIGAFKEYEDKQTHERAKTEKKRIQKLEGLAEAKAILKSISISTKNLPVSIILLIALCIIFIIGYIIYLKTKKK